jgi:hypothetical protein
MIRKYLLLGLLGASALVWGSLSHRDNSAAFEAAAKTPEFPAKMAAKTAGPEAPELGAALRSGKPEDKARALETLLPELMKRDFHAAGRLAESLEPWAWREEVLHRVARTWAGEDFPAAAKWAVSLRDPQERSTALNDVCIQAADRDPAAAVALADRFRMGEDGDTVMENLLQAWAAKDFTATAAWLEARPEGEARDKGYLRLALARSATNPEEAATLAVQRIAPGPLQDEAVIAVLHQWTLRDPEGAAAWVADFPQSDLRGRAEEELAGLPR